MIPNRVLTAAFLISGTVTCLIGWGIVEILLWILAQLRNLIL